MTPTPQARAALLVTAILGFMTVGSGMSILGPSLPVFAREFGLTTVEAGWLIAVQWTGCLLGVVAMFFWSERVSNRPGLAAIALGATTVALSHLWVLTLAGAFVFGLGYGAIAALFNPRIMMAFGPRGPSMLSLINAVFSLGAILAPYGFVLAGEDPRPVFLAIAAAAAVTWVVAWPAGMTGVRAAGPRPGVRLSLPILAMVVLAIGIETSLAGLGPTALIRTGRTEAEAAQLLSALFIVSLAVRVALTLVADRVPAFALFTFAALWAGLCALGAALVSPLMFFPAMGISTGLFFQGGYVTASRKMGDDPRVPSIILGTGLLGSILSPLIYARAMEPLGPQGFFWLIAAVAGGLGLAALAGYRRISR